MTNDESAAAHQARRRWIERNWAEIRSTVDAGLAEDGLSKVAQRAADSDSADRQVKIRPSGSSKLGIARPLTARLNHYYELETELTMAANDDALPSSGNHAIREWALTARLAERAFLIEAAKLLVTVSDRKFDRDALSRISRERHWLIVPVELNATLTSKSYRTIVHESGSHVIRLPAPFRYVRLSDFELTWDTHEKSGWVEFRLKSRVRLDGWDPSDAQHWPDHADVATFSS